MKKTLIFGGILATACWCPAQAMGQEGAYINAEYWKCPTENLEALSQASDTIWGPLFDELVDEGRITSWISLAPISFVKEDGRVVTEMPAAWNRAETQVMDKSLEKEITLEPFTKEGPNECSC